MTRCNQVLAYFATAQLFAYLVTTLLLAGSTHASFGACIAMTGPSLLWRAVVGFKLWNDNGEEASQYRSVYLARQTKLENNNWAVNLKFSYADQFDGIYLRDVGISNSIYGEIDHISAQLICTGHMFNIYYICYDSNDRYYCHTNRPNQTEYCTSELNMGTDTVRC